MNVEYFVDQIEEKGRERGYKGCYMYRPSHEFRLALLLDLIYPAVPVFDNPANGLAWYPLVHTRYRVSATLGQASHLLGQSSSAVDNGQIGLQGGIKALAA